MSWIRFNNPAHYFSYTTEMVKGVIACFENPSLDRSVVSVVFTGTGPYSFCTAGNTKPSSEYYSMRPDEYGQYMELFNHMVDAILACKKPVLCRVNGMREAGGQEIVMAWDMEIFAEVFGKLQEVFGQSSSTGRQGHQGRPACHFVAPSLQGHSITPTVIHLYATLDFRF